MSIFFTLYIIKICASQNKHTFYCKHTKQYMEQTHYYQISYMLFWATIATALFVGMGTVEVFDQELTPSDTHVVLHGGQVLLDSTLTVILTNTLILSGIEVMRITTTKNYFARRKKYVEYNAMLSSAIFLLGILWQGIIESDVLHAQEDTKTTRKFVVIACSCTPLLVGLTSLYVNIRYIASI